MSFLNSRPDKVFFYCQTPPKSLGGETPVADCAAIWQQMDPKIKSKFQEKGVRYHRNYVISQYSFQPLPSFIDSLLRSLECHSDND
jgi:hypothetical protein